LQLPIPDDWDGESSCRWSVCWPDSPKWRAILSGLIESPRQGRFWDASTGSIVGVQQAFKVFYDYNFVLKEVFMACGDNGLDRVADAIYALANKGCCDGGGSGGSVGVQVVINSPMGVSTPVYGSQPPASLGEGEVPPGYPGTLEEYDSDKCRTAAAIVRGLIGSLRNLSWVSFINTTGLVAVVLAALAGAIVLPVVLVPLLIAAAIGTVGLTAGLRSLADAIEADFDNWVCALYEGDSTDIVVGLVSDLLDAAIATIPAEGALAVALKTFGLVLMNSDTVNQLFLLNQGQGEPYDCVGCLPVAGLRYSVNNEPIDQLLFGVTYEFESLVVTGWGGCGPEQYFATFTKDEGAEWSVFDLSGATPCDPGGPGTNLLWSGYAGLYNNLLYSSNSSPGFPTTDYGCIFVLSSTPFTVEIVIDVP